VIGLDASKQSQQGRWIEDRHGIRGRSGNQKTRRCGIIYTEPHS
jgi:hypothetical protein